MRWGLAGSLFVVGCTYTPVTGSNATEDAPRTDAPLDDSATPDAPTPDADTVVFATCPGYQPVIDGFPAGATYLGVSARMGWQAARQACQADGADLVVVDGDAEGAAIIKLAADPGVGAMNSPFIWIGVRDDPNTGTDNDFLSVRGGPATFLPWGDSQPNGGNSDCVLIADDSVHDFWDFGCNATQVFVCECLP